MRLGDVADLPVTLDTGQFADILGIGKDHAYAMAREGTAPVVPVRVGRSLRWPTAEVLRLVGIDPGLPPSSGLATDDAQTAGGEAPPAVAVVPMKRGDAIRSDA